MTERRGPAQQGLKLENDAICGLERRNAASSFYRLEDDQRRKEVSRHAAPDARGSHPYLRRPAKRLIVTWASCPVIKEMKKALGHGLRRDLASPQMSSSLRPLRDSCGVARGSLEVVSGNSRRPTENRGPTFTHGDIAVIGLASKHRVKGIFDRLIIHSVGISMRIGDHFRLGAVWVCALGRRLVYWKIGRGQLRGVDDSCPVWVHVPVQTGVVPGAPTQVMPGSGSCLNSNLWQRGR
jgi:hypothetical protein